MEWINTDDIVRGDIISWTEPVFAGSYRSPVYCGDRTVTGIVEADSYGSKTGRHTFSIRVIFSSGESPLEAGSRIRRSGKKLYDGDPVRLLWADETARDETAREKHSRGYYSRLLSREYRRECKEMGF